MDRARGGQAGAVIDETPLISDILRDNIYGVDINPASVEIAKLALWLHSARAATPLSSLEHTIRNGNSLVGEDFWAGRRKTAAADERVKSFDWRVAFPEVWPEGREGGFDIVLGNPPYVKLQNLMKVYPEVAAYLTAGRAVPTPTRARKPATSTSICLLSRRACGSSPQNGRMGLYRAESVDSEPVRRGIAPRVSAAAGIWTAGSTSRRTKSSRK